MAAALACLTGVHASPVAAQKVTLSAASAGASPSVLGYNSGHFLPGSNTGSWWKLAGVNGSRIFSSPSYLTPGTSTYFRSVSTSSLNASSQAEFVAHRDALRASGTATTYIRWDRLTPRYDTGIVTGNNAIQLKYAEDTMRQLGIKPLVVMTRSPGSYDWPASPAANAAADWQDRWLAWQQWYAHAFMHARDNDVENYQFFNEPDLYADSYGTLTQEQWLEMIQVGANAVESAIADVNRIYGKDLTPHIHGPVTTSPDTSAGGWGNLLLNNRTNQLFNGPVDSYRLFDHYDYHNYGSSPASFGAKVADTIAAINIATGGDAANVPVVISEFNTRTSGNYDPFDAVNNPNRYTPDSPAMSSRLGQILANVTTNGVDELYLFKFSTAGGVFNGVHWQSETGTKNVGGATRSAVAYQLFAEGFRGTTLLAPPQSPDTDLTMAAAYDVDTGRRYAFITNETGSQGKTMSLDLAAWNVAPGSTVSVKQVSGLHQGGISQLITVPENRTISVNADPFGVVLVTAPTVSGIDRQQLPVSDNAYVQEGSPNTNFSGAETLLVRSGNTTATHSAAYLKFAIGDLDPDLLFDATLSITAFDPGATATDTAGIICHVYGITDTAWRQTTTGTVPGITWANAPNISQSSQPSARTLIDQNYVTGVGTTADIVGQFAATGTATPLSLDVSRWVAERLAVGDSSVSFMITRDVRFDGDIDANHLLAITSREAAAANTTLAPTLTLSTLTAPITIDVALGTKTQLQTGNSTIRGTSPVTKIGEGSLVLDVANSTSGETTIRAGAVRLTHPQALGRSPTTVLYGGRLVITDGVVPTIPHLELRGGTLAAQEILVGGASGIPTLVIEAGGIEGLPRMTVAAGGFLQLSGVLPLSIALLELVVDATANGFEGGSGGRLDLGAGQVTVAAGGISAADLRADIIAGRNNGGWNGAGGIMSSAAAASGGTRAVGYVVAPDGSARVSYAAAGDVDLSGQVNVFDLVSVNSGGRYGTGQSAVWNQGDFNYDGVTNVFDLVGVNTAAVYGQGNYLPASPSEPGGVAAVPEPATGLLALTGLAALGLAARRHRRQRDPLRRGVPRTASGAHIGERLCCIEAPNASPGAPGRWARLARLAE